MKSPIRIAVLECDTPLASIHEKYGGYGSIFTTLLHHAADAMSMQRSDLEITTWDVVNREGDYPALEDVDAILMTGSKFNAFDNDSWVIRLVEFVQKVLAQDRVRIIGVCYGHQIVGRAMGAKVARSESGTWEVSVCDVQLTPKGKEVFGKDLLSVHQMHKDIVYHYPEGVEELGWSDQCEVQAMYIPKKVITIQAHPEFTEDMMRELLEARRKQKIFNEEVYQDGIGRAAKPQDGVLVAKAFLRFLME